MNESELRKLIREEIKNQLIKEESVNAKQAIRDVVMLDAEDMEYFLKLLSVYFLNNKEYLDNIDSKGIARDLSNAYKKMKNRTGN